MTQPYSLEETMESIPPPNYELQNYIIAKTYRRNKSSYHFSYESRAFNPTNYPIKMSTTFGLNHTLESFVNLVYIRFEAFS